MDAELLRLLADLYALGHPTVVQVVSVGYGSTNTILADGQLEYFLKQYVERRTSERVRDIQAVEQWFLAQGLPVVAALPTRRGDRSFIHRGRVTALFPFVTGKQYSGRPSTRAVAGAGALLARLHLAGSGHAHIVRKRLAAVDRALFIQQAEALRERIVSVAPRTPYSDLAWEFVDLKMRLVHRNAVVNNGGHGDDDHLLHGDYHLGNLLFSDDDRVRHVFDFERAVRGPRAADVALALFYMCFGVNSQVDDPGEDDSLGLARAFLESYLGVYPMGPEELERGIRWFMLANQIYMLWPVTAHYLDGDTRADVLLPTRIERCRYLVDNCDRILMFVKAVVRSCIC